MMRPGLKKLILLVPIGIAAVGVFVTVGGSVVQYLWNWLLPPLFGWRELTFWQALGMLALCRILFGGFGFHDSSGRSDQERRRRMAERLERMTPEERERFRQSWRGRWGFGPSISECNEP